MAESVKLVLSEAEEIVRLKKALAASEAKNASLPQLDKLTQLPNKALFEDRLSQGMARARRSQRLMAIIYLDIHHTKLITAKLGVVGKNTLTREFTTRFKTAIRETDTLARIGFERYAVMLEEVKSQKQVKAIVSKIISNLDEGFVIDGNEITVTTSIGVAFYDGGDSSVHQILKAAEQALTTAGVEGKSAYQIDGGLSTEE